MTDGETPLRPRVCMVAPSIHPIVGGLERQLEDIIPALRDHGVDAWVLTRRVPGTPRRETYRGFEIRRVPVIGGAGLRSISFTLFGAIEIMRRRRNVDIVHAHGIMSPATVAVLTGLILRKPRLITLHAVFELERLFSKPLGKARLRLYRAVVDRFISITRDIGELLRDQGVAASRILDIPNGIDTARFVPALPDERAAFRVQHGIEQTDRVVVFVGRLHRVKQVDLLLRAWRRVHSGHLWILGDGSEREQLEQLATELAIRERVTFHGMVTNVDQWVSSADVFVLPSASEALSMALLEAMGVGITVVASAVGAANELIVDGYNGLLVPPGDIDALAAALQKAIDNDEWRAMAGLRSQTVVAEQFDLRVVAEQLASVYHAVRDP